MEDNDLQLAPQTQSIEEFVTDKVKNKLTFYGRGGTSYHGHPCDQVKSLMQKAVRRGDIDIAIYCALEFDGFNHIDKSAALRGAPGMVTNCINRLIIMTSEDVGIGCCRLPFKINHLYELWEENRKDIEGKGCLLDIVTLLCKSYKSRYVSYVNNVYICNVNTLRKYYPEFYQGIELSYDRTLDVSDYYNGLDTRVKIIYQGLIFNMEQCDNKYFYWLGLLLADGDKHLPVMWEILKNYASQALVPHIETLENWYNIKKSENHIHLINANLCVLHESILLLDVPKSYYTDDMIWEIICHHYEREPININKDHYYALDRHTREGKAHPIRRFHQYFASDSARVNRGILLDGEKILLDMYKFMKDYEDHEEYKMTLEQYLNNMADPCGSDDHLLSKHISPLKKNIIFYGYYLSSQNKLIGKESEIMQNPLRVNVTSVGTVENPKGPTYFAVMHYKSRVPTNVFVKGPINNVKSMWYSVLVDELKPLFGLNKIGIMVAKMVPDLYINNKQEGYFYIMEDKELGVTSYAHENKVINKERLPHPLVPVPVPVPVTKWNSDPQEDGTLDQYFDILLFRQMIATSDTNNTNIVVFPDTKTRYLSVDENYKEFNNNHLYQSQGQEQEQEHPGKKYGDMITNYLNDNKDQIGTKLLHWIKISQDYDFEITCDRYENLVDNDYCNIFKNNIKKMAELYLAGGFKL